MARFTLCGLLLAPVAVGACLFMARDDDWLAAGGLFVAFVLLAAARMLNQMEMRHRLKNSLYWLAAITAWVALVDAQPAHRRCPDCETHYSCFEFRVAGAVVHRIKGVTHRHVLELIAEDLDRPCPHESEVTHPSLRLRGLLIPDPIDGRIGICCLGGADESYYQEHTRPLVKRAADDDPTLADEFHLWLSQGDEKDMTQFAMFVTRFKSLGE